MSTENHDMKKGVDAYLLKRLFHYTRPYLQWIILALVLLLGVIAVELIRPVLIGNAVDRIIADYHKVYVQSEDESGVLIGDSFWEVANEAENQTSDIIENKATIIIDGEGHYYFVPFISEHIIQEMNKKSSVVERGGEYYVKEQNIQAYPLTAETIRSLRNQDYIAIRNLMLLFVLIIAAGLILNYFQRIVLNYAGQHIIYRIRDEVFSNLMSLLVGLFSKEPVGKLVTRVTNDTETLNEMYTSVIVNSVKNLLMLIGITIMMLVLDWQLTLLVFLVLPLIGISVMLFRRYSREAYRDVRTKVAGINSFYQSIYQAWESYRCLCRKNLK